MKRILTTILAAITLQSYALNLPDGSIAKQIQDKLYNPSFILGWNEGEWLNSLKMPYVLSEEMKNELLSKSDKEWFDETFKDNADEALKAQSALGVKYLFGVGTKQNTELGLSYLKGAADKGRAASALYIAIAYVGGTGDLTKDYIEALKWYKLTSKLDTTDKYNFDLNYIHMWAAEQATVRKDYKQAVQLYKEALEYGNKDAAAYLAVLYIAGLGVDKDNDKAVEYAKLIDTKKLFNGDSNYSKFSDKLSPEAIVGLLHANVALIDNNSDEFNKARLMLDKAVRKDDPIGAYLAHKAAYAVKDFKYAAYAIDMAAKGGLPAAQYESAKTNTRLNINPVESFDMFKQAAEGGYSKAYSGYASNLYNSGDYDKAFKWLNKAVEYESDQLGKDGKPYIGTASDEYLESTELLAKSYLSGNGVEQNKDKAIELIDELIKQVDGRIGMTKIQADPSIKRNLSINSLKEHLSYYSDKLNSYVSKQADLMRIKDRIKGE